MHKKLQSAACMYRFFTVIFPDSCQALDALCAKARSETVVRTLCFNVCFNTAQAWKIPIGFKTSFAMKKIFCCFFKPLHARWLRLILHLRVGLGLNKSILQSSIWCFWKLYVWVISRRYSNQFDLTQIFQLQARQSQVHPSSSQQINLRNASRKPNFDFNSAWMDAT